MHILDLTILIGYIAAVVGFGCWFAKRSGSSDEFMAAGGRLPGWAVGLSLFGTFLSSNTFIGNPGKAFSENWNFFVFTLTIPIGAWIASKWFVPFFRNSGEISAYTHLEKRFGRWSQLFVVICYLLIQISRSGTILLGVSIGAHAVTGWDVRTIILVGGILITVYTLVGGIEAVIWTDVIQSIVLTIGAAIVVLVLLTGEPGGSALLQTATEQNKFSLGDFSFSFQSNTFWVVLLFGIFINLTNFGIDQNYIQRYHTAKSEADAKRSLWLGAVAYIPVSALFFLIGTLLFGYYQAHPDEMGSLEQLKDVTGKPAGDNALPHFMANHLAPGLGGLLVAALFAAAMSTIDTSLNSSATITLRDVFRVGDDAPQSKQMRILRLGTIFWGIIGTALAWLLSFDASNILDLWWKLSGTFSGWMLGLFLLGWLSKRASSPTAIIATLAGVCAVLWIVLADGGYLPEHLRIPISGLMNAMIGTLTILLVGFLIASVFDRRGERRGVR